MSARKLFYAGVSLVLGASMAGAFESNKDATGGQKPADVPTASKPGEPGQGLELTTPNPPGSKSGSRTEVRIPGLGVIGTIPKMDFGLELLYGASEPGRKGLELDESTPGELTVKGRVKREF